MERFTHFLLSSDETPPEYCLSIKIQAQIRPEPMEVQL